MQPGAVVAPDVAPHDRLELDGLQLGMAVDRLGLHRMEERFHVRIVGHRLGPVHALHDAAAGQAVAEEVAGVFAAAVGVEDEARGRAPSVDRAAQRIDGELDGALRPHLPPHQPPRVLVDDHGEVAPAPIRLQVGDVAAPDLVGCRDGLFASLVGQAQLAGDVAGQAPVDAARARLEAAFAHEAGDALAPAALALASEQRVDPRAAVGAAALLEVLLDQPAQALIAPGSHALSSRGPRVEPRARDLELRAHPRHFEPPPLPRDEGEPFAFSCARKRSNFFRNSCSLRSSSSSRFSLAYFDISTIVGALDFLEEEADLRFFAGTATSNPSRANLRHRDSMNGWISSASATSMTRAPGALDNRTAVRFISIEYRLTFLGPLRAAI